MDHNWSANKQHLHLQSVAEISRHSASSEDSIQKNIIEADTATAILQYLSHHKCERSEQKTKLLQTERIQHHIKHAKAICSENIYYFYEMLDLDSRNH